MTNAILRGKPDAGNPHVRFDEGEVASAKPRRGYLLYKKLMTVIVSALCAAVSCGAVENLTTRFRNAQSNGEVTLDISGTHSGTVTPDKVFDYGENAGQWDAASRWQDTNFPARIVYHIPESHLVGHTITLTKYRIDTSRIAPWHEFCPVGWTLSGSNDGESWTVISTINTGRKTGGDDYNNIITDIDESVRASYRWYKFEFTESVGYAPTAPTETRWIEIANINLLGEVSATAAAKVEAYAHAYEGTYDQKEHAVSIQAYFPTSGLVTQYSTDNATWQDAPIAYADVGVYTVYTKFTAEGFEDAFYGRATVKINPKSIAAATIDAIPGQALNPGRPSEPLPTVNLSGYGTLVKDRDYTVRYENNDAVGVATMYVTGVNNYKGEISATFMVTPTKSSGHIYVDPDATGTGDGSNWANAVRDALVAVQMAEDGATVYFKAGVHPIRQTMVLDSLTGEKGISFRGGYAGDGTPGTRSGETVLRATGTGYGVLRVENCARLTFDSLTVENGYNTEKLTRGGKTAIFGGGIFLCNTADTLFSNVTVRGNASRAVEKNIPSYGGGIALVSCGGIVFDGCTVARNSFIPTKNDYWSSVSVYGGGFAVLSPTADNVIRNTRIYSNTTQPDNRQDLYCGFYGGGVYHVNSTDGRRLVLVNNRVSANGGCYGFLADGDGAGLYGNNMLVSNCVVALNAGVGIAYNNTTKDPIEVVDSIVWGHAIDVRTTAGAATVAARHSLFGETSGGTYADCVTSADPLFGPDFSLDAKSPAKGIGTSGGDAGCVFTSAPPAWTVARVDPVNGDDANPGANGYRSLTAALAATGDWTRFELAKGQYTAETGETYPIFVGNRIGVHLKGPANRGAVFDAGFDGSVERADARTMCVSNSALKVEGVTVSGAYFRPTLAAEKHTGAGFNAMFSGVIIANSTFSGNVFKRNGGGGSWPSRARNYGSGIGGYGASLLLTDVTVAENVISSDYTYGSIGGVGLCLRGERCVVRGNTTESAVVQGIAFALNSGSATFRNSLFVDNVCTNGIITTTPFGSVVLGSVVLGSLGVGTMQFDNCTFAGTAGASGYAHTPGGSNVTLALNNSVWDVCSANAEKSITAKNCYCAHADNVSATAAAANVIAQDGDLVYRGAAKGDYRPAVGGVLVNAGAVLPWMDASSVDLTGAKRIVRRRPDIGCYELGTGLMLMVK